MRVAAQIFSRNLLLGALARDAYERFAPHLELVTLPLGTVLYEGGEPPPYAYFPANCIISFMQVMSDGRSAQVAIAGREGAAGLELLMDEDQALARAVVQSAGQSFRLRKQRLVEEFEQYPAFRQLLLRYTRVLLAQIAQNAVCNRHHPLEQQLCRWLLLSFDRVDGEELVITQEVIANMLGVRREGVTEAAGKLQKAGLIRHRRGHIAILDHDGLEHHACECYKVIEREARLVSG